jgi:formylglycine-generating enzyme required for sulfatase activity
LTRGDHSILVDPDFWIGEELVSNELFFQFVKSGGYTSQLRRKFLTKDGASRRPADWPKSSAFPPGEARHPVSGISYLEAQAFVRWCNEAVPPGPEWAWTLPFEDDWELAARSESGLTYPWGDAFDPTRCNSAESGPGQTTAVDAHPSGASRIGCRDMAGNVWEFVESSDNACVLRGGSYKNNRYELRSYLRLVGAATSQRASDFGFRLVQKRKDTAHASIRK